MKSNYDVFVIGTGTAGYTLAHQCKKSGKTVGICDWQPMGGTCAMRGCQPKKYLVTAAEIVELAKALSIHASTCSNMLDKLEAKGLIERKRSGQDQRALHLYITDHGSTLLAKAPRPAQGALSGALEKLADDDLHKLADGLKVLVGSLQTKDDEAEYKPIFEG